MKGRSYTAYIACKPDVIATGATYVEENLVSGHA